MNPDDPHEFTIDGRAILRLFWKGLSRTEIATCLNLDRDRISQAIQDESKRIRHERERYLHEGGDL